MGVNMKKVLKKIFGIVPYIFLLVSFILIISLTISIKNGETPTFFGRAIFHVPTFSHSMEPTIEAGDIILVNTKVDKYMVSDVITFKAYFDIDNNGQEEWVDITHRIVSIETRDGVKYYTTQGDNTSGSESWETDFTQDKIIGKYVGKSTIVGTVYDYIFSGGVSFIFIGIIVLFLFVGGIEIFDIIKQANMQKEKTILEEKEKLIQEELERLRLEQKEKDES